MHVIGNTKDHCCYVAGYPCKFLEENTVKGRRWACGLRRELKSWDKVHNDTRYLEHVKPHWKEKNIADCGDWPGPGNICAECGVKD